MTADRRSIIVITGPPGAGKTTVGRMVADGYDHCVLLAADDFFHYIRRGYIPPWEPTSDRQNGVVTDAIAAAAVGYALGGYLVIVEGIIGPWFIDRWVSHVPDDLAVHYLILLPPLSVALDRAIKRAGSSDLTDAAPVILMHKAFTSGVRGDRHIVDPRGQTATETASMVRRLVDDGGVLFRRNASQDTEPRNESPQ